MIACERPSGILLTFGGQTALNCGVELYRNKVFEKYGVKIMGTPIQSIIESEDRQLFATKVQEIGEQVAPSKIVKNIEEAVAAGKELGYPVYFFFRAMNNLLVFYIYGLSRFILN